MVMRKRTFLNPVSPRQALNTRQSNPSSQKSIDAESWASSKGENLNNSSISEYVNDEKMSPLTRRSFVVQQKAF